MGKEFEAKIIAKFDTREQMSLTVKNVGSMDNAKKHARKFAKSLNVEPVERNWKTERTNYSKYSEIEGSWESRATRRYVTKSGTRVKRIILRA